MSALSENKTVSLTIGFAITLAIAIWFMSRWVSEIEGRVRALEAVKDRVEYVNGRIDRQIADAKVIYDHRLGDVTEEVTRIDGEIDRHHHHP